MAGKDSWLLYGATGYTGNLIVAEALRRGYAPVLGGRNAQKLKAMADPLGLEYRVAELDAPSELRAMVRDFSAVVHAVGPFLRTHEAMAEACLDAGTHYLDLAAESAIYENLAAKDDRARAAGVMIMPGVGFDMVPFDCLAVLLKRAMPDATSLEIAVKYESVITQGSARSALLLPGVAPIRRNHQLVELDEPLSRPFDFGSNGGHALDCISSVFGEAALTWRSTGIPNITGYFVPNPQMMAALAAITSEADILELPEGPSAEDLEGQPAIIIAEVRNDAGDGLAMRMVTPQVYLATGFLAAEIAQRVSRGVSRPGFQTPASVFGEDFILGFPGCEVAPWPMSAPVQRS